MIIEKGMFLMKKLIKQSFCLFLCVILVAAFVGCQTKKSGSESEPEQGGVDTVGILNSLMATDQELEIAGKYNKLSDITDGTINPDLVGTWVSADGDITYTFSEDGTEKTTSAVYGDSEVPFTCLTVGEQKLICEEIELSPELYDGAKEGDTQLSFATYRIENDALYRVIVEEINEDFTSNVSALVSAYRADDSGDASASIAKNPIDIKVLNGTWESEKGSFTVADGTLKYGEDSYQLSFNEKHDLVVEKDGKSTVYGTNVAITKDYDYDDRSQFVASTTMGLYFTGADENDKPNLLPLLDDYKTEYGYDSWYYSGNFKLQ